MAFLWRPLPGTRCPPPEPLPHGRLLVARSPLRQCSHEACHELPYGPGVVTLSTGLGAIVYPATYYGSQAAAKVVSDGSLFGDAAEDAAGAAGGWMAMDRELRVLPYLRHKNVVAFLHYVYVPRRGVHVMLVERMAGGFDELMRHLDETRTSLTGSAFLQVATDIASALAYIDGVGIVHADVKPENILLSHQAFKADQTGRMTFPPGAVAKLADFGVCLLVDDDTGGVRDRGYTEGYLAPECCAAASARGGGGAAAAVRPSPARDMFAFGKMLQEILGDVEGQRGAPPSAPWVGLEAGAGVPPASAAAGVGWLAADAIAGRSRLCAELPAAVALARALTAPDPAARPSAARAVSALTAMQHRLGLGGGAALAAASCEAVPPPINKAAAHWQSVATMDSLQGWRVDAGGGFRWERVSSRSSQGSEGPWPSGFVGSPSPPPMQPQPQAAGGASDGLTGGAPFKGAQAAGGASDGLTGGAPLKGAQEAGGASDGLAGGAPFKGTPADDIRSGGGPAEDKAGPQPVLLMSQVEAVSIAWQRR